LGRFGRELLLLAGGFAGELAGFALGGAANGACGHGGLASKKKWPAEMKAISG
jgi:hypothetical protein